MSTTGNTIGFKGIAASSVEAIKTNSLKASQESQDIFSEVHRGAGLYLFNRTRVVKKGEVDLTLLDWTSTENTLNVSNIKIESKPGELVTVQRTKERKHIAQIFNGLDLIVMNCNQVLENMQKNVYKDFQDTSKIALANFTTSFDELKEQVSDMLSNINTVDKLKESVAKISARWKIEIRDFMLD